METSLQQLRALRERLPNGKKDNFGKDPKKRILLYRAFRRPSMDELTAGELAVVEEFLEHCKQLKMNNKKLEFLISKLANV